MSRLFFILAALFAALLLSLLLGALRSPKRRRRKHQGLDVLGSAPQHLCNMSAIRQSFADADLKYVQDRGGSELAKRLRQERRRVAFLYLAAIRDDFEGLLNVARVVSLLSPEVSGLQEYERLRLSVIFRGRFQVLRLRLLLGSLPLPQLGVLGEMVTSLSVQLEAAMAELGERAAMAAELALQSDR